jgi:hypothetical protein
MNSRWIVLVGVIAVLAVAPALAQQKFIYPAKGQSPQQQQKDEYECYTWAAQQSGYDPTKPSSQASAPSQPAGAAPGSGAKGALRGAAVGGVVGGIGGRGGEGAAAGAVIGGIAGRQRSKQQQQQQQQQQQANAQAAGPDAYNRARTACLSGRGYNVN